MSNALDVDVVFLIEGEEEQGSFGFEDTVRAHQQAIGTVDFIILSNSYWLGGEQVLCPLEISFDNSWY